jgi:hypothetical protein
MLNIKDMKILAIILLSLVITPSVIAETFTVSGNMTCDNNGTIIKEITKEYNEQPIAIGKSSAEVTMALLYNEKTKTWTIIGLTGNATCVLAAGTDLRILNNKTIKHYVVD